MTTTYHLNANELSGGFIEALKNLYGNQTLSITVEPEMDETEYLMSTEANRNALEKSLKSQEGYEFTIDELKELSSDLLKGNKINYKKLKKIQLPK